jgi:hypothetical protein
MANEQGVLAITLLGKLAARKGAAGKGIEAQLLPGMSVGGRQVSHYDDDAGEWVGFDGEVPKEVHLPDGLDLHDRTTVLALFDLAVEAVQGAPPQLFTFVQKALVLYSYPPRSLEGLAQAAIEALQTRVDHYEAADAAGLR